MADESKDKYAALRIALIYLVVGGLWVSLSDRVVGILVHSVAAQTRVSTIKGVIYVLATAWMLYALIYRNLSAIRRSDLEKLESEENYKRIVETTQEGIWMLDSEMVTFYANQRLADMLGYRLEEIIGQPVMVFVHPEDQEELRGHIRDRIGGQGLPYDFRFRRKDGSDLWAIVSATSIVDGEGSKPKSFAMLTDITARRLESEREKEYESRQKDFYRRTILAATEGKLVIEEDEQIHALAGPAVAEWRIDSGKDLAPLRSGVQGILATTEMTESRQSDFILCVGEAATNACKHANNATATLHKDSKRVIFVVSDKGPGIEALTLPEVALARRYSTKRSLGMGYKAMISLADRIYLSTGPSGTTVAIEMELIAVEKPLTLPDLW